MARNGLLDALILAVGVAYVATAVVSGFVLWPGVERLLVESPAEFAAAFDRLTTIARNALSATGTLGAVLVLVALVREGGVVSRRGRMRLAAIIAFVATGLIGALAVDPARQAILAAAEEGQTGAVAGLVAAWAQARLLATMVGAAALAALVLAHRAPIPPPATGPAALSSHHRRLLLLLGTATLFEGYDRFIVTLALPYIARDLGAAEGTLGWALSAIRSGSLLALGLCAVADRAGRRGVLLVTVLGYTVVTALTGLSRGLPDFVGLQLIAVAFLNTELALSQVVIAEEFPAGARGMGQGLLGAAGAVGAGLAAILFPIVVETALGWRGLYFIGILPLVLVGYLRRSLPETRRWEELDAVARRSGGVLRVLAPAHRWRFLLLLVVAVGATAANGAAFAFASYRATTMLDWTPEQVSSMVLIGGGIGFWGWMLFGRVSDAIGRRPTGVLCLSGGSAAIITYYGTAQLFPAFAGLVFFESGALIAINALSTESFPTPLRATARAWIANAAVGGAMVGLAIVGAFTDRVGGHAPVIVGLAFAPLLLAPLLLLLPETRGRELEVTSGVAVEADRAAC